MKPFAPLPCFLRGFALLAFSALTLAGQTTVRPGVVDPAGNPSNFTLFREQRLFTISPGTQASPWQTSVAAFDGDLKPIPSPPVSQLPWSNSIPRLVTGANQNQPANIQAVAGRIAHPDKDDIAIVHRSESDGTKLAVRFTDGSGATLLGNLPARLPGWTDFFATSAGDLDRLYDRDGNYHDEVVVAWTEEEVSPDPNTCPSSVPHIAVLNYNNGPNPSVITTRIDRTEGYIDTCLLQGMDYEITNNPFALPITAPLRIDNIIATAVGDFDGDGYNEIAVAYLRGQHGVAITVVIYRYQSDGANASLKPVNTVEMFRPDRSVVGTLSLAAGDFDGSGSDQLLVGSAYYWGDLTPNLVEYRIGTLRTQPVFFLIKGGQVAATITGATSTGTSNAATEFTVSPGTGAYVPRTVTLTGGTGRWAAVNGTWPVTLTANGFSIAVDTSDFGPYAGQSIQFGAAAPLTNVNTMETDAFPGRTYPSNHIDENDIDGRIRVQMVPGLFRFDPAQGFDYRRRQVAVTWNFRIGTDATPGNHLGIIEVTADDKITLTAQPIDAMGSEGDYLWQMYQSFSLGAGALRGANATNDPTWSIFVSGLGIAFNSGRAPTAHGMVNAVWKVQPDSSDPAKLQLAKTCVGKAATDGLTPAFLGVLGTICQLWGYDARLDTLPNMTPPGQGPLVRNYLRLPAIAADLNGNSLRLGAPVHIELTNPGKAHFILEQPPQHAGYLDLGTGPGVVTINRFPSFNTEMKDSQSKDFSSNTKNHSDWNVGASEQVSASNTNTFGSMKTVGFQEKLTFTEKVSYDFNKVQSDYSSSADSYQVGTGAATGQDDSLIVEAQIYDVWRYRIFGATTQDPQNPNPFYEIVLPGPSLLSNPGGRDVDWYQPIHEAGNILSYPSRTDVCSPTDLGPITIPNTNISNQPIALIKCSQQFYNGNRSTISLKLDNTSGGGTTNDYTHKIQADVDFQYTMTEAVGVPGIDTNSTELKGDVDVHGGGSWGQLTTSDNSTTDATGITVNSPQGDSNHAYPYYPILYNTTAGGLKVAYGVGDLSASAAGSTFWVDNYAQLPDPALNLPNRFQATYNASGNVSGWEPITTVVRKRMKGLVVRKSTINPVTGGYDLLGSNPKDGDIVMLEARVYNYSLSMQPTGPVTVQFSVIPYDSSVDNEICPGIPATGRGGRVCPASARTIIGNGSSAPAGGVQTISLNARENKLVYLMWNTKGLGPQAAGVLDYRVYVNLIAAQTPGELYPPEPPCTAVPCEDGNSNQKTIDPGQNNEGWSLISVAASPSPSPISGARIKRLSLKAGTHLGSAPQGGPSIAYLRQPVRLQVGTFGNAAHPTHNHVAIFNGKPDTAGSQTIATKTVHGTRSEGAHTWHDWRPASVGPYHLYTTLNEPGNQRVTADYFVEVTRAPGDLNSDGRVDTHDLNILSRDHGKPVAGSACGLECDLNNDGKITQTDSTLMSNLCESTDCAFASPYYADGRISEEEPDMQVVRTRDIAARTAWLAAHPEEAGRVSQTPPQINGLAAYQQELARKQGLRSTTRYWFKGKLVSKGQLAPKALITGARVSIHAEKTTRTGTQVDVPLTIVNSGAGPLKGIQLTNVSLRTLSGSGQATVAAGTAPAQIGDLLPGASKTITVRLNVPVTVQRLSIMEEGQLTDASGAVQRYSVAQAIIP